MQYARRHIHWLAADAATTTYVINDLGFQPEACILHWDSIQSATNTDAASTSLDRRCGMGAAVSSSDRRCIGSYSQVGVGNANCGNVARNDSVACTVDGSGTADGELDLQSFDSGGATFVVDDATPQDLTIIVDFFAELDVAVLVDIAEPAATGNVDYTVTGFDDNSNDDQVVWFWGMNNSGAINTPAAAADSGRCMGWATGTGSEQMVLAGNSDDGSGTMDTDSYVQAGECLANIAIAGGNPNARASLTQFATDNFRLNWAARATTNRRYFALAMKASSGGHFRAGEGVMDASSGNDTETVSGLSFTPNGVSVMCRCGAVESTAATAQAQDVYSYGSGASTSDRSALASVDINGGTDSVIGVAVEYDAIQISMSFTTGAVSGVLDLSQMNSDGFQLRFDTAPGGSATSFVGWLTWGNASTEQTVEIGLNTEADSAFAMGWSKAKAIGQNTETDLAQAMGRVKVRAIGLNTESDTVTAMGRLKAKALGLASSTEEAFDIVKAGITVALGMASEIATALQFSVRKLLGLGLTSSTETAQAMGRNKTRALGLNTSTELAFSFTFSKLKGLGLASETDAALAMPPTRVYPLGLVSELSVAQAFGRRKTAALGLATSAEQALDVSRVVLVPIGQADSTEEAFAFTHSKALELGIALEFDTPLSVTSDQIIELYWKVSALEVGGLEVSIIASDLLAMLDEVSGE